MAASIKTRTLLGLSTAALLAAGSAASAPVASRVKDLGAAPASLQLKATVHLPLTDEKGFDAAVAARYDRKSPLYHQWMSQPEIDAFGPAKSDVRAVRQALAGYGLTITGVSSDGAEIDVTGAPASLQRAFGAPIRTFSASGRTFFGAAAMPQAQGDLAGHVAAVTGLTLPGYQPMIRHQLDASGRQVKGVNITVASPLDAFSNQCFTQPAARTLTDGTNTATATAGVGYAITLNSNPVQPQTCGYTPAQVLQHYGIDQLHSAGFDGTGQTIVIVDAYGSPSAMADANTFFAATGVTPFTKDNFKILYPHGKPTVVNYDWAGETALDIEWAHVIAPGAKIVLVVSQDNQGDLDQAVRYAISHNLGNVISNSWGSPEFYLSRFLASQPGAVASYAKSYDHFMRVAAAKGISVQFSTGDDGDALVYNGSTLGYASPGFPSTTAHSTAVGGTSLDVPSNGVATETGWGNYRAQLGYDTAPAIPPVQQGFYAGAGGGDSMVYAKPNWERKLAGSFRKTPDVGMMADPYTGAILVEPFGPGDSEFSVIGGTSLASPMFTALWAIADQMSNPGVPGSSLGLAAVMMPNLVKAGAVVDVAPLNPTAQLTSDFEGPDYDAASYNGVKDGFAIMGIAADPGAITTLRLRAYDGTGNGTSVLSFNTDTTLQVANGWDNVTGYGVPNGPALMSYIQGLATAGSAGQ